MGVNEKGGYCRSHSFKFIMYHAGEVEVAVTKPVDKGLESGFKLMYSVLNVK